MNPLTPFGTLYGLAMDARNLLYDRGILRSHSLGARTISIGNLTTGGTGKTPLVAFTARILAKGGAKVCVLTRGYGRRNENERVLVSDGERILADAAAGGDEPVELAHILLGKAVIVADADRVAAAEWAREKFGITAFVLDDAFQHRRAKRDIDIVCVDATDPFGNGRVLPAGRLREPLQSLARANIVIVTRANLVDTAASLAERLSRLAPNAEVLLASSKITVAGPEFDRRFAFCGLGNPENFRKQLISDGFQIAGFRSFGDHHRYTQDDIDQLDRDAKEEFAAAFVTTGKDVVKLSGLQSQLPVQVAELEVSVSNEEIFREMVLGKRPSEG